MALGSSLQYIIEGANLYMALLGGSEGRNKVVLTIVIVKLFSPISLHAT